MNLKSHIAAYTGAHRYILGPINWLVQQIVSGGNSVSINIILGDTTTTAVINVDVSLNCSLTEDN